VFASGQGRNVGDWPANVGTGRNAGET